MTNEITRLENSAAKLSVTIDKKELQKRYTKIVSDFASKVQIKGFR
jgi:trigger factor